MIFSVLVNSASIDSGISSSIENSSKLSMTKVIENVSTRTELAISAEKESGKKNRIHLFEKNGFFGLQVCDFSIEKANLPENTIFFVNQGYLNFKDNKRIYYNDIFIIEQITPLLNQPENINQYSPKEDEVKILRPKYNDKTGSFLGLEYCVAYSTFRNDENEKNLMDIVKIIQKSYTVPIK